MIFKQSPRVFSIERPVGDTAGRRGDERPDLGSCLTLRLNGALVSDHRTEPTWGYD